MTARAVTLACALVVSLSASKARAQHVPPPAYQSAARAAGVPSEILFAVALQESGIALRGQLIPWPWTLNAAGEPSRYATRRDACAALRRELKTRRNVDVGLGQVNVRYHGHRVKEPCELLDPYRNLAITATILREQHAAGADWLLAVSRYHRPAGGAPAQDYRERVERHLARLLAPTTAPLSRGAHP